MTVEGEGVGLPHYSAKKKMPAVLSKVIQVEIIFVPPLDEISDHHY